MTYIDLTMKLTEQIPVWSGDVVPSFTLHSTIEGEGCQTMRLLLGSHSGTHIDSPAHLIEGGKSLDHYDVSRFFARCAVLAPDGGGPLPASMAAVVPSGCDGILLAGTTTSLEIDAARLLLDRGVRLFGFAGDSCDEPESTTFPVHRLLMGCDALIIENLANLDSLVGRVVDLVALPLFIEGSDGAPARVIARLSDDLS